MFHIANKVYLEYDFRFTHMYPFIVASERWSKHPILAAREDANFQAPSFEELILSTYQNDVENFWSDLINKKDKFVVYCDVDTFTRLQIEYWKSIFEDLSVEDAHFLHTSYVESRRLVAYNNIIGQWDRTSNTWSRANILSEVDFIDKDSFVQLYNSIERSPVLTAMDKTSIGVEYLLADYFADNETPYKSALFDRIKFLTWDNWIDELEHLKYEILSGTIDAGKLDPTINTTVGNVEEELAKSEMLSWTVDPLFREDVDYIRSAYDPAIFVPCWAKLAEVWGHDYDDMEELNTLINADDYEALLERDIARNYGCSYTRTRFMNKANQSFATWVYECVRKEKTSDLSTFRIKR